MDQILFALKINAYSYTPAQTSWRSLKLNETGYFLHSIRSRRLNNRKRSSSMWNKDFLTLAAGRTQYAIEACSSISNCLSWAKPVSGGDLVAPEKFAREGNSDYCDAFVFVLS